MGPTMLVEAIRHHTPPLLQRAFPSLLLTLPFTFLMRSSHAAPYAPLPCRYPFSGPTCHSHSYPFCGHTYPTCIATPRVKTSFYAHWRECPLRLYRHELRCPTARPLSRAIISEFLSSASPSAD
ncbi:hypothetical protein BD414DRAFT_483823 [Trametes punicea]|nr:hypothetical protein BD414DRAFT_483823 [Trametes punicea]